MFEAPSGKTNHNVPASQPAMGLSTTFALATTDFEGLSTGFPRPSRTTGRACDHRSMLVAGPLSGSAARPRLICGPLMRIESNTLDPLRGCLEHVRGAPKDCSGSSAIGRNLISQPHMGHAARQAGRERRQLGPVQRRCGRLLWLDARRDSAVYQAESADNKTPKGTSLP